jgi:hypothetical protein
VLGYTLRINNILSCFLTGVYVHSRAYAYRKGS